MALRIVHARTKLRGNAWKITVVSDRGSVIPFSGETQGSANLPHIFWHDFQGGIRCNHERLTNKNLETVSIFLDNKFLAQSLSRRLFKVM